MPVTFADVEADTIRRTKQASEGLLAALTEHHDHNVKRPKDWRPVKRIPIHESPASNEPIEVSVLPIQAPKITVDGIKQVVCRHYGITHADIISPRRDKKVVRPRMIAVYLSRAFTSRSLPEIARRFGNRDHTTALHSVNTISNLIATDAAIAADVKAISAQLTA